MTDIFDTGKDIIISDIHGNNFEGKIYSKENSYSKLDLDAIVCKTNSEFINDQWEHNMSDIYKTKDLQKELKFFVESGITTHLIIIPENSPVSFGRFDRIDALSQKYISKKD